MPPFSMLAKKIPAKLFSPSGAPKLSPQEREHNVYNCHSNKKHTCPSLPLPQHSPQKLPKSCHHISKHLALLPFSFCPPAYALHALQAPRFYPPLSQYAFTFIAKLFVLPASLRPLVWHPLPTYALLFSP